MIKKITKKDIIELIGACITFACIMAAFAWALNSVYPMYQ